MRVRSNGMFGFFLCFLFVIAASPPLQAAAGPPLIETNGAGGIALTDTTASWQGGQLVVKGKVKRSGITSQGAGGHLDIVLVSADGAVLAEKNVYHTPRIIPRRGAKTASFKAVFEATDQKVASIRVAYHPPSLNN